MSYPPPPESPTEGLNQIFHHHKFVFPSFDKRKLLFLFLFLAGIAVGIMYMNIRQDSKSSKNTITTVTITGTGQIKAPSDSATLNNDITITDKNETLAKDESSKIVKKLKEDVLALGIPASSINSSTYSTPKYNDTIYQYSISPTPPLPASSYKPESFSVNTTFDITLNSDTMRYLDSLNKILENTPSLRPQKPSFYLKDSKNYESQAREKALEDARAQIDNIAKLNNMKVKRIASIKNTANKDNYNYLPNYSWEKTVSVTSFYEIQYELESNSLFSF